MTRKPGVNWHRSCHGSGNVNHSGTQRIRESDPVQIHPRNGATKINSMCDQLLKISAIRSMETHLKIGKGTPGMRFRSMALGILVDLFRAMEKGGKEFLEALLASMGKPYRSTMGFMRGQIAKVWQIDTLTEREMKSMKGRAKNPPMVKDVGGTITYIREKRIKSTPKKLFHRSAKVWYELNLPIRVNETKIPFLKLFQSDYM